MIKSNSLKQLNLVTFTQEDINEEELKFMIDSSIYGMFGYLESNKIKYMIKKEARQKFIIKAYEK